MLGEMRNVCNGGVKSSLKFFECDFEESTYDNVLVHCLVGSSIHSLCCMDNRLDMAAFFAGMMNNHSKISLSKLCLGTISRQDIDILATFLPMSTGLHELTLSGVARCHTPERQPVRLEWGISNPRRFFRCCVEMSPCPICLPILIWTKGLRTARRTRQIWSFSPCSFGWRAKLLEWLPIQFLLVSSQRMSIVWGRNACHEQLHRTSCNIDGLSAYFISCDDKSQFCSYNLNMGSTSRLRSTYYISRVHYLFRKKRSMP
jgi:hypothetical protein